ncbi:MAG: glycosyltransferase family 39 protein [Isosphaeraceae bacterium]
MLTTIRQSLHSFQNQTKGLGPLAILLFLHFLVLACFFAPAISTPDANGYLAQARIIAREGRTDIVTESPAQYVGDHWMPVRDGQYYGQYPPGLPALLAVVFRLLGPVASLWVIPLMGTLALLALFLIVRSWFGPDWALIATILMAVNPFGNAHALGADSHTAVCFFLLWGIWALLCWESSRSSLWAAVAGFCFGMIPTIRYPEALFLAPALYLVATAWRRSWGVRSLIAGTIAACLPMAALAARNQHAFGAFWRTGYSISGEQTGFGPGYFVRSFLPYILLTVSIGAFVVFLAGVLGIRILCRHSEPIQVRRGRFLLLLTLPITLLYMSYYWGPSHNSMRFLLPTFYIYAIGAAAWFQRQVETDPDRGWKRVRLVVGLGIVWGVTLTFFELRSLKRDNTALAELTRGLQEVVAPGSLLIASSGIQQHLDFVGDWRLVAEETFDRNPRRQPHVRGGPRPPESEPDERIDPVERSRSTRLELAHWAGPSRKVYWLTTRPNLDRVQPRLSQQDEWIPVAELRVSPRPGPPPPGRGDREPNPGPPRGWLPWGPPPPPPDRDGPPGRRGPGGPGGGPPPHFEPPPDGRMLLVEWRIHEPG